jgi:uncharacterized membrane protein YdjX (TVP38/TMEM64 family)
MKNGDEQISKTIIKGTLNILSTVLSGAIAILFTVYAFTFKSLKFISEHFYLLNWLTVGFVCALLIAYIIFYLLEKQSVYRLIFCLLICLDIFAVIFYFVCATGIITKINSIAALREYIRSFGSLAVLLFIAFQFLQVVVLPVPGSVSVAAGVALFGPLRCALFSFIGIVLGSFVAFAIGRVVGYKAVCWIVGKDDLDKWLNKIKGKDYLILSIMFLLPLFPDDILCFVAGLSSMSWHYFIIMIIITRAISVLSTAYSFDLIPFNTWWGILIWLLLVAIVVLSFYLVCKYSDKIDNFIKTKFKITKKKNSSNK